MDDPQIEELKELVRQNIKLSQETYKVVHSMRSAARWGRVLKLLWLGLIVAAALGFYVYFSPYISKIIDLYGKVFSAAEQVGEYSGQITNLFNKDDNSTTTQ